MEHGSIINTFLPPTHLIKPEVSSSGAVKREVRVVPGPRVGGSPGVPATGAATQTQGANMAGAGDLRGRAC
ncbi:hypothetical protein ACOMHN_019066 [Nucella lapillus]